jgi:hypothetical protein
VSGPCAGDRLGRRSPVQEKPMLFARVSAALAPVRIVALLLPSPGPEESVRIPDLAQRPTDIGWRRRRFLASRYVALLVVARR